MSKKLVARFDRSKNTTQSLRQHCVNTAQKTSERLSLYGLKSMGQLIGFLHDLGKSSSVWQQALQEAKTQNIKKQPLPVPHAPPAARAIYHLFSADASTPAASATLQILCMVIYAHHGYLMDALSPNGKDHYNADVCAMPWGDASMDLDPFFKEVLSREEINILWQNACAEIQNLLKNISRISFSYNSNKDISQYFLLGLVIRVIYAALIDADRLDAANFEKGVLSHQIESSPPNWNMLLNDLESRLSTFSCAGELNQMRAQISSHCQQAALWSESLLTLHAPTGSGKTLASLRLALWRAKRNNRKRIIYVVSYTTILDQVHDEYLETFSSHLSDVDILLHHSSIIPEDIDTESNAIESEKFLLLAERWDADIILTTQVQFFNAFYLGTGKAARRLPALQNSVIIIDEVQTIPPKLVHLFSLAVTFLKEFCNCDIVLSSATQPTFANLSFPLPEARSILQTPNLIFEKMRRVILIDKRKQGFMCAKEIADFALQIQKETINVLIVHNTRTAARLTFEALLALKKNGIDLYLLSNDLCPAHRKKIIHQLATTSHDPLICVSTQLIECGVDLSFGSVIRSFAGADSICQAAGRCNRHADLSVQPVYIISSADENLDKLKDIQKAQDACNKILSDYDDADMLQYPSVMEEYYKYYFANQNEQLSYNVHMEDFGGRYTTILDLLSYNNIGQTALRENQNSKPKGPLPYAYATAGKYFRVIDQATSAILVPFEAGEELIIELNSDLSIDREKQLLRQAQLFSVTVYEYRLKRLIEQKAVYRLPCGAFALRSEWYDSYKGLVENPENNPERYII